MSDFDQKLLQGFVDRPPITPEEAAELVRIAESAENYRQVSKALCGKENATLEEVLQAVSQVKADLAAVKRERDAAVFALHGNCDECCWKDTAKCASCVYGIDAWNTHDDCWEWDGVCPENSSDEHSCLNCKHQGADGRGICMDCGMDYRKWELLETEVQGDG